MKIYGLIGFPLGHSFSKKYFTEKFIDKQISAVYQNFELKSISEFPAILKSNPNLYGLSVTSPYKEQVIPYLDELSDEARKLQAVNCITINRDNGKIITKGYNTDVYGFQKSLVNIIGNTADLHALILGTGGAAKAVAEALSQLKISYTFVSRTESDKILLYNKIDNQKLQENKLIINASPVGMHNLSDKLPDIPVEYFSSEHIIFDLIYNPEETLLLKEGRERGAKTKNGLEMLHLQAERAWEIFNDLT